MHTQTHSSLSYTHKTKWLLAQDCGTGEAWAPSMSRPRVLKAWLISRGRSRHWSALICEVRWGLGHTSTWNSWTDSFPVPLLMQMINTSRLWKPKMLSGSTLSEQKIQSSGMCHFSNQGGMGTGNPSMTLQGREEKRVCGPFPGTLS